MFDTHAHLNFKAFKKTLDDVINKSKEAGVKYFLIPGTDIKTSKRAVEIAGNHENIYAAVGIHPHHVYRYVISSDSEKSRSYASLDFSPAKLVRNDMQEELEKMEELLKHKKVVAIGEVGLDCHVYQETKYADYYVSEEFINLQQDLLVKQIDLALKHNKSVIFHNREAVNYILDLLNKHWDARLSNRAVFHCCEPEKKLLDYAIEHQIYIGVDGDITYNQKKQDFIRSVPQELLVVETDSPFLLPEPLKTERKFPNIPANLKYIVETVAKVQGRAVEDIIKSTTENSLRLFRVIASD